MFQSKNTFLLAILILSLGGKAAAVQALSALYSSVPPASETPQMESRVGLALEEQGCLCLPDLPCCWGPPRGKNVVHRPVERPIYRARVVWPLAGSLE
jgi:hypothetical protein